MLLVDFQLNLSLQEPLCLEEQQEEPSVSQRSRLLYLLARLVLHQHQHRTLDQAFLAANNNNQLSSLAGLAFSVKLNSSSLLNRL